MAASDPRPTGTPAWLELTTTEPGAAQDFYGGVFDWEFADAQPPVVARLRGLAAAGITTPPAGVDPSSAWLVYLAVADADDAATQVRAGGGEVLSGPEDRPGSRTVLARDPGGARFGLWEARPDPGAAVVNEPSAMCGQELLTRTFAATREFYLALLGYGSSDLSDQDWTYSSLEVGGVVVAGIGELGAAIPEDIPAHWMAYFGSADTDATTARAVELGGTVLNEPTDAGFGRLAVLQGPGGEVFSVVTMANP